MAEEFPFYIHSFTKFISSLNTRLEVITKRQGDTTTDVLVQQVLRIRALLREYEKRLDIQSPAPLPSIDVSEVESLIYAYYEAHEHKLKLRFKDKGQFLNQLYIIMLELWISAYLASYKPWEDLINNDKKIKDVEFYLKRKLEIELNIARRKLEIDSIERDINRDDGLYKARSHVLATTVKEVEALISVRKTQLDTLQAEEKELRKEIERYKHLLQSMFPVPTSPKPSKISNVPRNPGPSQTTSGWAISIDFHTNPPSFVILNCSSELVDIKDWKISCNLSTLSETNNLAKFTFKDSKVLRPNDVHSVQYSPSTWSPHFDVSLWSRYNHLTARLEHNGITKAFVRHNSSYFYNLYLSISEYDRSIVLFNYTDSPLNLAKENFQLELMIDDKRYNTFTLPTSANTVLEPGQNLRIYYRSNAGPGSVVWTDLCDQNIWRGGNFVRICLYSVERTSTSTKKILRAMASLRKPGSLVSYEPPQNYEVSHYFGLVSMHFRNNQIVLRNVSSSEVDITSWKILVGDLYPYVIESEIKVGPGAVQEIPVPREVDLAGSCLIQVFDKEGLEVLMIFKSDTSGQLSYEQ
eukprot:TRINITY_DN2115_c0_g3_i1.p1 TRINITY_DN2115_c0_g3~~TRINITY_DN2115_c0_g3_i1.p1  ORF type:complete len:580 (+),score=58.54 TRINITY_DN2115_c0_g3_i1:65-1804(+)